jgi:dTDP-glucose 4,6-dehydratase/UDP-glucose 4-epimerase
LITGGLGFIGSNLARRLVELDARVTLIDSLVPTHGGNRFNIHQLGDRLTVLLADLRDREALEQIVPNQDYLFNLAGQTSHLDSMREPEPDRHSNVDAQLCLLECVRKSNPALRTVFASTRQIYGRPQALPVTEAHPLDPVDINGVHKLTGELYHGLYHKVYGVPVTTLRLTNTYGPRMRIKDDRQTFLGTWIGLLLAGEPIKVFGDGEQLRDFNYVDDVVDAMLGCAADQGTIGRIYNLGSREVISLRQLAELLVSLHAACSFELVAFPGDRKAIDIGDYYSDFSSIKSETGWSPKIELKEGLKRTLEFFNTHGKHYL